MKSVSWWLVAFMFAIAGPAAADWRETKWGTSPLQVEAAAMGAAPRGTGESGERVTGFEVGNAGTYEAGEIRYRAVFYYRDGGLGMVKLKPPGDKCGVVKARLRDVYGPPLSEVRSLVISAARWRDAQSNSDIGFLDLGTECSVNYRPYQHDRLETGL